MQQEPLNVVETPLSPSPISAMETEQKVNMHSDEESIVVVIRQKRSAFLSSIVLLIVIVVANVLYFLYNPEALFRVLTVIFFVNFGLLMVLLYIRKQRKTN